MTLLGRNGMGKTTTIRTIMGVLPPRQGTIELDGTPIHRLPPYRIARLGLGLVPEGRQVFPNLTVRETWLPQRRRRPRRAWELDTVLRAVPGSCARGCLGAGFAVVGWESSRCWRSGGRC